MSTRYPVPAQRHRVELVDRGSRFIATVARTPTVDEARAFIDEVRAEMPDATHHVYAFVVGHGATVTHGMSDAGEPSGTAGRPALAVLEGSGLGDTCVVVTRYFGGTKLGTGGLVRAYGDAVRHVLEAAPRTERVETQTGTLRLPYALYDTCQHLVETHGGTVEDEHFAADVTLRVRLAVTRVSDFEADLAEATSGQIALEVEATPDT